jgi:hypothetical protein
MVLYHPHCHIPHASLGGVVDEGSTCEEAQAADSVGGVVDEGSTRREAQAADSAGDVIDEGSTRREAQVADSAGGVIVEGSTHKKAQAVDSANIPGGDVNEGSTHGEVQAADTGNSPGGDVTEGGESQTTPLTPLIPGTMINALDSTPRPASDTTAPSRPIRSKTLDALGPSTRATNGNYRLQSIFRYHL